MGFKELLTGLLSLLLGGRSEAPRSPRPRSADRAALVEGLDPSPFGLNSHLAPPGYLKRFGEVGIRWHRVDIDWSYSEREKGRYDWGALDAVVGTASQSGLSLLGVIAYTPAWASRGRSIENPKASMPNDPSEFLGFVDAVLGRYAHNFRALSIWNEPNLRLFFSGTREEYINHLLVPGLQLIRSRAPHIVLAGPDLSSSGRPQTWLGPILDAAGDLFDVIAHHQYDGGDTPRGRAGEIDKLRRFVSDRGFGDRPIWITETGWNINSRDQQARFLTETMVQMQERHNWWTKTFWYDSHGQGFGLLAPDGDPRQGEPYTAFDAYSRVVAAHGQSANLSE